MRTLLQGCVSILWWMYRVVALVTGLVFLAVLMGLVWVTSDEPRDDS